MDVRYYRDPVTGVPHIHDQGVTEAEVQWILTRPGEDRPSTRGTRQAIGADVVGPVPACGLRS